MNNKYFQVDLFISYFAYFLNCIFMKSHYWLIELVFPLVVLRFTQGWDGVTLSCTYITDGNKPLTTSFFSMYKWHCCKFQCDFHSCVVNFWECKIWMKNATSKKNPLYLRRCYRVEDGSLWVAKTFPLPAQRSLLPSVDPTKNIKPHSPYTARPC